MKRNLIVLLLTIVLAIGVPIGTIFSYPALQVAQNPLLLIFDKDRALTFEGALAIAEELDRIGDRLEAPVLPADNMGLMLLAVEIVPYFHYENISDGKVLPVASAIRFALNVSVVERNFHVLGSCRPGPMPQVEINARFANPVSSWYLKNYFATVVHELGHSQGVYKYNDASSEPATQIATLEVLAAMAGDGNVWALPSFVRELQGYAEDYAWSKALQENRLDDLRAYLEKARDNVFSEARFERAMRHWKNDMDTLKSILKNYGETPYRLVIQAMNRRSRLSNKLEPFPNFINRIFMDDTYWTLWHLHELANDYPYLLEIYYERHGE